MPELVENTRAYVQALYRTYGVPVLPNHEATAVQISRNIELMLHNTQSLVITQNRRELETLTATAIDSAVTGFTRAGLAFQQGNNAAGGVEIARSLSSVCTTVANFSRFGKAAGPAGIVLTIMGEALSLVAFFLDTFVVQKAEDREKSLLEDIETMIRGVYAEQIEDHLRATIETLQTGGDALALRAAKYPGSLKEWQDVVKICPTLGATDAFTQLIATEGWLEREKNQRLPDWDNVFEAYCCATARQAENYLNGLLALKTHLTEKELLSLEDTATSPGEKQRLTELGETADLALQIAMNFITGYADNRRNWINKIRPVMVNNVNTWSIDNDRHLNFRRQTFSGKDEWQNVGGPSKVDFDCPPGSGISKGLALGPGGRIWARVNGGAQLFTRLTDDPVGFFQGVPTNLASGILDFCVVPGLTKVPPIWRVYTIQGGEVGMFNWDEDQRRGLGRMSLGRPLGADVVAIAATTRSRFWALTRPHTLAQLEHSGTAVTVKGGDSSDRYTNARLVANGENLFVYGGKNLSANILVIPHGFTEWKDGKPSAADKALSGPGYPGDGSRAWCIPGPTPDLGVPPQWPGYNDLFASDDGSLLALISWKAYRWIDGQWSAEPGSPAPRFSLCTRPVPGWEEFLKLRDMFSNMVGNPAPT